VDLVDAEQRRVLLVAQRRTARALHAVAAAEAELADLLGRHVDVVLRRQEPLHPQEAVALVAQVEVALDLDRLTGELLTGPVVLLAPPAPSAAPAVARLGLARLDGLRALLGLLLPVGLLPRPGGGPRGGPPPPGRRRGSLGTLPAPGARRGAVRG